MKNKDEFLKKLEAMLENSNDDLDILGHVFNYLRSNKPVFRNKKNGSLYVLETTVINATNAQDGEICVLYRHADGLLFIREENEFYEKFELVS